MFSQSVCSLCRKCEWVFVLIIKSNIQTTKSSHRVRNCCATCLNTQTHTHITHRRRSIITVIASACVPRAGLSARRRRCRCRLHVFVRNWSRPVFSQRSDQPDQPYSRRVFRTLFRVCARFLCIYVLCWSEVLHGCLLNSVIRCVNFRTHQLMGWGSPAQFGNTTAAATPESETKTHNIVCLWCVLCDVDCRMYSRLIASVNWGVSALITKDIGVWWPGADTNKT